jgi:hypothetical protein
MVLYKNFNIDESVRGTAGTNRVSPPHQCHNLMKMVDDFEKHISDITMEVDVVKLALAQISACKFVIPMTYDQETYLKRITTGYWIGPTSPLLNPNPIESRHIVASGRVRNLVHSGMLGLLATRLVHDPTQVHQRRRNTYDAVSIIQRANNQDGYDHVKYSIHEFQCKYNVGCKHFKVNPFMNQTYEQTMEQFNLLDTAENREEFLQEYRLLQQSDQMNHSRVIHPCSHDWLTLKRARLMNNEWFASYFASFSTTCKHIMRLISDGSPLSCLSVVNLYKFVARFDWILTDPNLRSLARLNTFYPTYLKRLFYLAGEGVEHSAYVLMRFFPEMMTPELHMHVNPKWQIASVIGMHVEEDDPLFGPMKLACQSFMPVAQPPRNLYRDDYDDYNDYDDYDDYDDNDYDDDNDDYDDDNVQG